MYLTFELFPAGGLQELLFIIGYACWTGRLALGIRVLLEPIGKFVTCHISGSNINDGHFQLNILIMQLYRIDG